jgi:hypothetical protein
LRICFDHRFQLIFAIIEIIDGVAFGELSPHVPEEQQANIPERHPQGSGGDWSFSKNASAKPFA